MSSCISRLGDARSGGPRSETGSGQPESAAVTAREGSSARRSEEPRSRVSWPPTAAATLQTSAEGKARTIARCPARRSGCRRGGAAETRRREAD